ncbi:hypothetical protein Sjap_015164 [Stephania japonica]|uniref:Phosphatidic acid phosphatase type 2/haloperoxidase domain-containing protein n=1 Tax=Stephania japonica TaxID=461633 RepID=A0AAP0IIW5_9MAGN
MMDVQHGRPNMRSHGVRVARAHYRNWLLVVLFGGTELILFIVDPFHSFVGKDMMTNLKYPKKNITIRFWVVPLFAVLFPIVVFLAFYVRRRNVYDLHQSILGLLLSVLITGAMTDGFKDAVGEPRPDFFWRCFPDGNDVYNRFGDVICHGKKSDLKDGYKSFPSGHTSWSFAGLGFLSLYLAGKIKPFDRKGNVIKLCITVLPLIVASLVGISVVDDHYHHWRDVFGGAIIGLLVMTFCYLQFFPPPYHTNGWGPWAYFHMLEQSRTSSRATDATTATNIEARAERQQTQHRSGQNNGVLTGLPTQVNESTLELEDIESGYTR